MRFLMKYLFLMLFTTSLIFAKSSVHDKHPVRNSPSLPKETTNSVPYPGPFFTGPLLTPAPDVVKVGHYNFQTYFFANTFIGNYSGSGHFISAQNTQTINALEYLQVGLTSFMDTILAPQVVTKMSGDQSTTNIGDLTWTVDFQLYEQRGGSWPTISLSLEESFPISKYQKLDPKKNGTDGIGSGSFVSNIGFNIGGISQFTKINYLSTRFSVNYTIPSPVSVKGFNSYGGGFGTNGKVYPGNSWNVFLGFEYTIDLHWVLACDLAYSKFAKTKFSGTVGTTSTGSAATMTAKGGDNWSLAPAIEYNWNASWGLIAGAWVSFAGKHSQAFANGIISLNYYK